LVYRHSLGVLIFVYFKDAEMTLERSVIKSNKQIGIEIKRIREAHGMSQMELAEEVGVSFQQIQKYEKGINRISVERIQQIAKALGTSVNTFFEKERVPMVSEPLDEYSSGGTWMDVSHEEAKLLQLFRKIDNEKIRRGLLQHLKGLGELLEKKG
jgi:transcriptional regulator with XRE-family HTH domain